MFFAEQDTYGKPYKFIYTLTSEADNVYYIDEVVDNPILLSGDSSSTGGNSDSSGKYIISGGAQWSGSGFIYDVSTLTYYFDGDKISLPTQVTLDASDPTDGRLDAIVVDEDGAVTVITGTPAPNPLTPTIPDEQLLVQYILVAAATTEPVQEVDNVYLENSEWVTSNYTTAGGVVGSTNFDGTSSPKQGVKCIENFRDGRTGDRFVRASQVNIQEYTMLTLWVRFTSVIANNKQLNLRFENSSGTAIGNTVNLFNLGLSRSTLNTWQLVIVPITLFGAITNVKGIKAILAGVTNGVPVEWDLDKIQLTDGSTPQYNTLNIYEEYTHSVLLGMKQKAMLKTGAMYGITDFASVYDQPDYDVAGVAKVSVTVKTGSAEKLILLATSSSTFAEEVYSVEYPNDKIKYDITWVETRLMLAPAKGLITERIDEFNNRTDFDHRKVVFKRYLEAVPLGEVSISGLNVTSTTSQTDFTPLVSGDNIKIGTDDFVVDVVTDFQNMTVVSNVGAISGTQLLSKYGYTSYKDNGAASVELPMFDLTGTCMDNRVDNFRHYAPLLGSSFDLPNNVITSICLNNEMREVFANNTINGCTSNKFGQAFIGNKVIWGLSYNYFGSSCSNNIILSMTLSSIWGTLKNSNIGSSFDNIIQYDVTDNLTTGSFCKECVIYGFTTNIVLGANNLKLKFWDAEDLVIENNNTSVDFSNAKNITAPNVMSGIKNTVFSSNIDGAAWSNYISGANNPELYQTYRKEVMLASDGNVYSKYFDGTVEVYTLID